MSFLRWFAFSIFLAHCGCIIAFAQTRCNLRAPPTVNIDLAKYADGPWYELFRSEKFATREECGLKCISASYELLNLTSLGVKNCGIATRGIESCPLTEKPARGDEYCRTGEAQIVGLGDLRVRFSPEMMWAPYWITGVIMNDERSDFDFALVQSCTPFPPQLVQDRNKTQTVWMLSRERKPGEDRLNEALDAFNDILRNQTVSLNGNVTDIATQLLQADQEDC